MAWPPENCGLATAVRYAVAAGCVALAVLLRWSLPGVLGNTPYLAFYPAVVAAAGFAGMGPGLLAAVASALCVNLWFDATPGRVDLNDAAVLMQQLIFVAGGAGMSVVAGKLRRSYRELRASRERFAAFMDHLPGAAWMKDSGGRYIYANPAAQRIYGRLAGQIVGRIDAELFAPETARVFAENDRRAAAEGGVQVFEILRHPDGTDHESLVSKFPVPGPDGRVACVGGVAFDITERRRAEQALRRFFESGMFGAIRWTVEGRITETNDKFLEMTGHSRADLAAGRVCWRDLTPPEYHHLDERALAEMRATGVAVPFEKEYIRRDGTRIPILLGAAMLDDRWHEAVAFVLDISQRKRQEEELKAARESAERARVAAEEANRAKDHFLAVLSHELRTPLAPVMTAAAMLREHVARGEPRELLEMICRNVEMEARLIDDLLDMTRIARGKVELHRRPVAICEVIRRAAEVCMPDIEARGLHFGVKIEAPPHLVHADAGRLQQVFWNLMKNAVKFTPQGGCVGVHCQREGGQVIVEVSDSGAGIAPEALARIFNAFEQAERSITRQFGGLGLGLTISKALVEMHGGSIEAHSEGKGKGAVFIVRLPVLSAEPAAREGGPVPAGPADSAPKALAPLRILLVEDHGDTAKMMRRLLAMDGHSVAHAGDVAAALDLAARQPFDLLISDLGLPDASGLDLLRELRARGWTFPAIALSGYGMEQDMRHSREAGFALHLTKPLNPEQFAEAIAVVMAGSAVAT